MHYSFTEFKITDTTATQNNITVQGQRCCTVSVLFFFCWWANFRSSPSLDFKKYHTYAIVFKEIPRERWTLASESMPKWLHALLSFSLPAWINVWVNFLIWSRPGWNPITLPIHSVPFQCHFSFLTMAILCGFCEGLSMQFHHCDENWQVAWLRWGDTEIFGDIFQRGCP